MSTPVAISEYPPTTLDFTLCKTCSRTLVEIVLPNHIAGNAWGWVDFSDRSTLLTRCRCPNARCPGLVGVVDWIDPNVRKQHSEQRAQIQAEASHNSLPIIGVYDRKTLEWVYHLVMPLERGHYPILDTYQGREFDRHCLSITEISDWIAACDIGHDHRCRDAIVPRPSHRVMLIDIARSCLIDVDISKNDAKYAALSYVWGSFENPFQTTKSTVDQLRKPGSLDINDPESEAIPNTIKDAIRLASSLKISYLWVDSLCIVQDDDVTRNIHLESMASIYAHAYVTFVAAEGNDANHGISGVKNGSRRRDAHCRTIRTSDGSRYLLKEHRKAWPVKSKWNSRAWTYQEALFSTRVLILDTFASWHCSCKNWQEDTTMLTGGLLQTRVDDNPHEYQKPRIPSNAKEYPLKAWAHLVETYNERALTRDEDAMNAFAGVMSLMRLYFQGDILFGTPETYLYLGLLWKSRKHLRRRKAYEKGINRLPGWSWVGWQGPLDLELWIDFERDRLCPQNTDILAFPITIPSTPGVARDPRLCCQLNCPHLYIRTTVHMCGYCPHHEITSAPRGFRVESNNITEGFLYTPEDSMDMKVLNSCVSGDPTMVELVAISTGLYKSHYLARFFSQYFDAKEDMIEMYNVLWLYRKGDTVYRRALGLFCREAWESCALEHCTVKLG